MPIDPYLFFNGRCEEAIDFYKKALGAEVAMMMRYNETPDPIPEGTLPPGFEKKVMHAQMRIGDASILASDGKTTDAPGFKGFSLTLTAKDKAECQRWFDALAQDGQVSMPLNKTFFAESFGMVSDRFGVPWMVIKPAAQPA